MKVKISGTMTKDTEPDNGLDGEVGDKLHANPLARIPITGLIELHGYHRVKGKPEYISIRFLAIEAALGEHEITVRNMLDEAREARGLGPTSLTLFDTEPGGDASGPWPGDADFKAPGTAGDQDDPDTRKADPPADTATEAKPKRARKAAAPKAAFSQ